MQNLLFVVSDDLFVELYRLAYGGKVDIFVDAVDAVELLIVYVYRRKAQGARALAEHSLSRGVSPFFDSMLPKEQVVPSMAAA